MHYQLTYDLTYNSFLYAGINHAGMDANTAHFVATGIAGQIASADQGVDKPNGPYFPNTTPAHVVMNLGKAVLEEVVPQLEGPPHKMTTYSAEHELSEAITPSEVGVGLHMYQDSFSHDEKARDALLVIPGAGPVLYGLSEISPALRPVLTALGHTVSKETCDVFDPSNSVDQQMITGTEAFLKYYASSYFK